MKHKATIAVVTSVSLLMGGFGYAGANEVHAESLKDKINDVKEKREKNKTDQDQAQAEIEKIKNNQQLLDAEIKKLDRQMAETNNKIDAKEQEIAKTKEEIEILKAEIEVLIKRIDERDQMLKDRITAMYENGGTVQYIEVILGSKSFGDFLDRVFALNEIAKQDKQILEAHKADKKKLEEMKEQVEVELEALTQQMKELEQLKAGLEQKVDRKNALLSDLEKEEKHMHEELGKLEDQEDLLRRQQAAFEAEKRRQEEAARKAAAERAAAEAAAKKAAAEKAAAEKASSNSGSSSNDDEQEEKATPEPVVSSSLFIKPANGYFSSGFGHRWGSMHPGVDIARGGSVPVVASASGTVIKSYYSSSYGNVIFIAHYLNGRTYTTVYAHLRTRYVGNGATVNKGEQIGLMGNTGRSTGQHLHFEIHQGSWNYNKSNAINPRQFF